MRPEDQDKFRQQLVELREDLLSTTEVRNEASGTVHLDQQSVGRLSRMDALQSQALAKAGQERANHQLRLIEAALVRIDNEEFGECLECGEPINPKRLEIDPTCLYCIDCER
jgi:RNA polymerase-binding transcription factor